MKAITRAFSKNRKKEKGLLTRVIKELEAPVNGLLQ